MLGFLPAILKPMLTDTQRVRGTITPASMARLRELRIWMTIAALLCGFTILSSLWQIFEGNPALTGAQIIGYRIFMAVLGLLYIPAMVFLAQSAAALFAFGSAPNVDSLERAIKSEKGFWTYLGVLMLIGIALTVVLMIVAVVIGVVAAAGAGGAR